MQIGDADVVSLCRYVASGTHASLQQAIDRQFW